MGKQLEGQEVKWNAVFERINALNNGRVIFSRPDKLWEDNKSPDEVQSRPIEEYVSILAEEGITIDVCNNIDITSADKSSDKYTVLITNNDNGNTYRFRLSDYLFSANKDILKIAWISLLGRKITDEEEITARHIIDHKITKGNEGEQILVYSQPGWIKPCAQTKNRYAFKYNYIYPSDIKGSILKEYSAGIGPDNVNISVTDWDDNNNDTYSDSTQEEEMDMMDLANSEIEDEDGQKHTYAEYSANYINRKLIYYDRPIEWGRFVLHLLLEHPLDKIIFGAGLCGVIRQLATNVKDNSIIINIVGGPGQGKTTIEKLMLSAYGNPDELIGGLFDTENSVELIRASRAIIPYVLDDRLIKLENSSSSNIAYSLIEEIFRESDGRVKQRLNRADGGNITYGAIISSSVKSMINILAEINDDIGQSRRLIELYVGENELDPSIYKIINSKEEIPDIDVNLFNNENEASTSDSIASNFYGYGILMFVYYLLDKINNEGTDGILGEYNKIIRDYSEIISQVEKKVNMQGRLVSSAKRFATIDYVADQFIKSLCWHLNVEVPEDRYKIPYILICNLVNKLRQIDTVADESTRIRKYVLDHSMNFVDGDKAKDSYNEYLGDLSNKLGIVKHKHGDMIIVYKSLYPLEKFLVRTRIEDPKDILDLFKEMEDKKDPSQKSSSIIEAKYPDIASMNMTSYAYNSSKKQKIYYYGDGVKSSKPVNSTETVNKTLADGSKVNFRIFVVNG